MSGGTPFFIRDLRVADEPGWRSVWGEYLTFYKVDLPPEVTAHTWTRLMDPAAPVKARVAVAGDTVLGFAIHITHGSTWVIGDDCYLEDLCVAEAARGTGIGRALIADLLALGQAKGWQRVYWHTDSTNARARGLYDQFVGVDDVVRYRVALTPTPPERVPPG